MKELGWGEGRGRGEKGQGKEREEERRMGEKKREEEEDIVREYREGSSGCKVNALNCLLVAMVCIIITHTVL